MPITMPPTTSSYARKVLVVLDTPPADPTAPTLSEANAGLFIACHVYGGGIDALFQPDQSTGEGPRKHCTQTVPTELGSINFPAVDIQYSYVPQAMGTPGGAGNEAIELLTQGTTPYILEGAGLDGKKKPLETDDVVNIFFTELGVQRRGQTGDGEFDKFAVSQQMILKDGTEPTYDYVLPAT